MAVAAKLYASLLTGGFVTSLLVLDVIILVTLAYVAWSFVKPAKKAYRLSQQLENIAGPSKRHWFFGHNKEYPPTQEGLLKSAQRFLSHPTMFNHWFAPFVTSLAMHHSDTAVSLLSSGGEIANCFAAPKNDFTYNFLRPWIGDGLLTSKGKKWQRNRHLLTPAFHFSILKSYAQISNITSKTMLDKWDKMTDIPIDVCEDVSMMTLDTMLKCAMSTDTDCQHVKNGHPYIKAVREVAGIITKRISTPYLMPDFIFWRTSFGKSFKQNLSVLHTHTEKIIAERRVALENVKREKETQSHDGNDFSRSSKNMLDFLDILIQTRDEDGKGLTDREIRDEVDTFLFEGHDTTSSGISWALYNLAKHPEIQEKCREEVKELLGDQHSVEWNNLSKFTYLTMFLKESMRLYPPVFGIGRKLDKPMTLRSKLNKYEEVVVPEGATSGLHIFSLHRNELMWEKPLEFDPERFTKENIAKRSPYAYLPFSAGSRNCIGQNFAMNEMKTVLALTLQRFRLYLDEETPVPIMQPRLILQSKDGIMVKFERLSK